VMSIAGFAWGLWRYSPRGAYRLKRDPSHSPYSGWMWWHHYTGIVFGIFTITWIFSGLLSMDPWDWHPSTAPTAAQRRAFAGDPARADAIGAPDLQHALGRLRDAREAAIVQFRGQYWLASDRGTMPLQPAAGTMHIERAAIAEAARSAMPDARVVEIAELTAYDAYYYDRAGELPLPAVRIRYDDPPQTWLYVDPARGTILRKEERLTRLNRWLYHGLHSLDFPLLYPRRPLWDVLVIALSLGGLALAATTLVPGWRRLRDRVRLLPRS